MDVGWMLDGWMLDVGCWMVGESGIKANSAQLSWRLAELGNNTSFSFSGRGYFQKYKYTENLPHQEKFEL